MFPGGTTKKRELRKSSLFCNTTRALVCYLSPKPPFCKEGLYIQQKRNPRNDFSFLQYHQGTGVTYLQASRRLVASLLNKGQLKRLSIFRRKAMALTSDPKMPPVWGLGGANIVRKKLTARSAGSSLVFRSGNQVAEVSETFLSLSYF